ncbi:MAG: ComEC/Rec2 family competence protein, partial [Lentisphaeria bacterium]
GTIHVFSVSGLNVAILASLLLFLLRLGGVPYGWRHALLPLPLGFYVVMTGAEAPAVRAWVMLVVWALARGRLRPVAPLNTIAIAAAILLLANPLHLGQVGFQFSFLLVLFLMLGWRAAGRLAAAAAETDRWRPLECRRRDPVQAGQRWWWRNLGAGLAGWLAGAGLIAWHNQLLIPAGLPVNLVISATAWLALAGGLLKVAVGWLPGGGGPDLLLAHGLEGCIIAMRVLAEWGAAAPASLPLPRPPAWSVVAYYAGLLLACRPWHGRRPWCAAGAGLAALCLGLWLAAPGQPRGPRLAMIWGEGGAPPAVALRHADGRTALWLPGGPVRARRLANWLRINGIDEIETLLLPDAGAESARTLETLAGAVTVRTAVAPANASGTVPARLRDAAAAAGCGLRTDAAAPPGPDGTACWCFDPAGLTAELERARNRQAAGLRFAGGPGVTLRAAGSGNTLLAVRWPGGTGAPPAWRHSRPGLRPHFEQLAARP